MSRPRPSRQGCQGRRQQRQHLRSTRTPPLPPLARNLPPQRSQPRPRQPSHPRPPLVVALGRAPRRTPRPPSRCLHATTSLDPGSQTSAQAPAVVHPPRPAAAPCRHTAARRAPCMPPERWRSRLWRPPPPSPPPTRRSSHHPSTLQTRHATLRPTRASCTSFPNAIHTAVAAAYTPRRRAMAQPSTTCRRREPRTKEHRRVSLASFAVMGAALAARQRAPLFGTDGMG